jgi:NAD(P)-dependent dehydrogenase (short-subunit alcohol dehydrogenase family)
MTRTAVVTGGGTGIGKEIARTLAADGLDVTITGRREDVLDKTVAELGRRSVRAVAFDAADPAAIEAALPRLPERVDVLVNNAGGNTDRSRPAAPAGDSAEGRADVPADVLADVRARWLAQLESNVISAVLMTTALTPRLRRDGRVIAMGSIAGARGSGAYGAAKAAVQNWAADAAARLGDRGITVNAVAPGLVEDTEFFGAALSEERRDALVAQTMNGRAAKPADIAALVAFLASPAAGHITGQVLHVNGGAFLGR